jgi:pentatricopeptide repeat protein
MILGHVKWGQVQKALKLFQQMKQENVQAKFYYFCGGVECMCQHICISRRQACSCIDDSKWFGV